MGFIFEDAASAKGEAESVATMHALLAANPRNGDRIFPYIGGEEVNNDPLHQHRRFIIDFMDLPMRRDTMLPSWHHSELYEREEWIRRSIVPQDYPQPVAADWPDLLDIVERRVRPKRAKDKREAYSTSMVAIC